MEEGSIGMGMGDMGRGSVRMGVENLGKGRIGMGMGNMRKGVGNMGRGHGEGEYGNGNLEKGSMGIRVGSMGNRSMGVEPVGDAREMAFKQSDCTAASLGAWQWKYFNKVLAALNSSSFVNDNFKHIVTEAPAPTTLPSYYKSGLQILSGKCLKHTFPVNQGYH